MPAKTARVKWWCIWLVMFIFLHAGSKLTADSGVSFARDGRSFHLEPPGFGRWHCRYAARVVVGGQEHILDSADGELQAPTASAETELTPYGMANVSSKTLRFPQHGVNLLLRVGHFSGKPITVMQAGIQNTGAEPIRLISVTPLLAEFSVAGDPANWRVTAFNESVLLTKPVSVFGSIDGPVHVWETGGFYRTDGSGFVFGPVGIPVAFVNATLSRNPSGSVLMQYESDMSSVRVDAGKTRWGQQVALLMESPNLALEHWANWVGASHAARTSRGAMAGWNSWAFLGGQVSGRDVLAVADATLKNPSQLRPKVNAFRERNFKKLNLYFLKMCIFGRDVL